MSITISTSDYTQAKAAVIDSVNFKVRPMTSSVAIAITNLGSELEKAGKDTKKIEKNLQEMKDLLFGLFDNQEKARKVLDGLEVDSIYQIYDTIMKGNEQNG